MHLPRSFLLALLFGAASSALAQPQPTPQNVVTLSANSVIEVPQDLMTVILSVTREAPDAAGVQSQLVAAVNTTLSEVRSSAASGQLDVRTGAFSVGPRYGNGRITGWRGTAEVVLEGRDFARVTQAAGRASSMTVASIGFGMTSEQRRKAEADAQASAIDRFKAKAESVSRAFGFARYTLREVNVTSNDLVPGPVFRMAAAAPMAATEGAPVPAEAGKSTVTISVSGSIEMR
jgi:predicted secreted protein